MSIANLLAGKRTYLTALATAAATIASVADGGLSPAEGGVAVLGTLIAALLRAGSKADAASAAALVTAQLAPRAQVIAAEASVPAEGLRRPVIG